MAQPPPQYYHQAPYPGSPTGQYNQETPTSSFPPPSQQLPGQNQVINGYGQGPSVNGSSYGYHGVAPPPMSSNGPPPVGMNNTATQQPLSGQPPLSNSFQSSSFPGPPLSGQQQSTNDHSNENKSSYGDQYNQQQAYHHPLKQAVPAPKSSNFAEPRINSHPVSQQNYEPPPSLPPPSQPFPPSLPPSQPLPSLPPQQKLNHSYSTNNYGDVQPPHAPLPPHQGSSMPGPPPPNSSGPPPMQPPSMQPPSMQSPPMQSPSMQPPPMRPSGIGQPPSMVPPGSTVRQSAGPPPNMSSRYPPGPLSPPGGGPPGPPVPPGMSQQQYQPQYQPYQQTPPGPMPGPGYGPPPPGRYGAPSQPGNYQMQGQQSQQPVYQQPQQPMYQQQQRLDPDAMPSVCQVIDDDLQKFKTHDNVIWATSIPQQVPPLVTTIGMNHIVQDGGSARPQHVRCTMYQVPANNDLLNSASIPLGLVVKPFDESEIEGITSVPLTPSEIVRCNRCRAYMSPFMRFIDGGRRFQCGLCHAITEVPERYSAHLDHTGQRLDRHERPELFLGSYEFKATSEFCRNSILNCRRPHIIFAFELTINSMPIVKKLAQELPDIIRNSLPLDNQRPGTSPPLVGFMTYNSKIQVYDVANDGHSHVICDINSTFPPVTSFLIDPVVHMDKIDTFLRKLPSLVGDDELETETILGPVIEAALQTAQVDNGNWMENDPIVNEMGEVVPPPPKDPAKSVPAGKVYLFHCTLPTYGSDGVTPGRLKSRWTTSPEEAKKLLGTDKEKQILSPEPSKYYSNLAQKCVVDFGSGVDLFLFPPINGSFLDIATLSELTRITGSGAIHKYYNESGDRFLNDLRYSLKATFAFEAVMKVRTSSGIRAFDNFGNYFARVASDIELASINAGNSIAVDLRYDDKLAEDSFAVIQVAILYTAVSGERRIRCHNIALPVTTTVADLFRAACCDTLMNLLLRQSVHSLRSGEHTVQQVKEGLINRSVKILTAYRKHCAQPGASLGQLILPEALKLLPMYVTGALKCDAIDGGPEMFPDDKAFARSITLGANIRTSQVILYPKLLQISYDEDGEENLGNSNDLKATHVRCSAIRLTHQSGLCYLLENGFYIFIYIPINASIPRQEIFCKNVFGQDNPSHIIPEAGLPELLTKESQFMNGLIQEICDERKKSLRVYIVRQGLDKIESVFKTFLYEDKKTGLGGDRYEAPSYVDLLCHLHKEIRTQLN